MITFPPQMRTGGPEEMAYRAVAQQCMYRMNMARGQLNMMTQRFVLNNGTEIICRHCFGKEDVWVKIPPVINSTRPDKIITYKCPVIYALPLFVESGTYGAFPTDVASFDIYITGTYDENSVLCAKPLARITDMPVTIDGVTKSWIDWIIEYAPSRQITFDNAVPQIGQEAVSYVTGMRDFIDRTGYVCSSDNVIHTDIFAEGSLQIYQIGSNASLSNDLYTLVKSELGGKQGWCVYNMPMYNVYTNYVPGFVPPEPEPEPQPVIVPIPEPTPTPQPNTDRILILEWGGQLSTITIDDGSPFVLKSNTPYVYIQLETTRITQLPYTWTYTPSGYTDKMFYQIRDLTKDFLWSEAHIYIDDDTYPVPGVTICVATLPSGHYRYADLINNPSIKTYTYHYVPVPIGTTTFTY